MTHSTTLSVFSDDVFTDAEVRTLAGFLGGYSRRTRDADALDLRQIRLVVPRPTPRHVRRRPR